MISHIYDVDLCFLSKLDVQKNVIHLLIMIPSRRAFLLFMLIAIYFNKDIEVIYTGRCWELYFITHSASDNQILWIRPSNQAVDSWLNRFFFFDWPFQ